MPNWAYNTITLKSKSDLATLMKKYVNGNGELDFNSIEPMPADLDIDAVAGCDVAICYYLTERLTKPMNEEHLDCLEKAIIFFGRDTLLKRTRETAKYGTKADLDRLYEDGRVRAENLFKHGAPTWYEWRYIHWGTKWNASYVHTASTSDTECILMFDTPWSAPLPILQKICKNHPDMPMMFDTKYEDTSLGIDMWKNVNGVLTFTAHQENDNND